MKKTFLFSLGLIAAFASLFVSCSEDEIISAPQEAESKYKAIDLGLPSGTKWATCNVGANSPEEYGGYYAWGEIEVNLDCSWETYKWCNGSYDTMTKYCTDSDYGTVDNKIILDPEDDVAHVKWGGDWRMPTKDEQKELCAYCDWIWTTHKGVNGYRVIGPNGNSIFLPAAGYRNGTGVYGRGVYGRYWSSSLSGSDSDFAGYFEFDVLSYELLNINRYVGLSVRPVLRVNSCTVSVSSNGNGVVSIKDKEGISAIVVKGSKVTVVAEPNRGIDFLGWFVDGSKEPVSTKTTYTFTVSENIALVAKFEKGKVYYINGHEYVDLGLPSGIKWATCNVGASSPEEYGGYYAWGETEEKSNYDWSTYKWCKGSENTMTKYCTDSDYGTVDNKTVLDPKDDVAHVKWGGSWRMPTKEEQDELRNKCTWTWTTQNGVKGYRVTGPNGNSIFLPAAGYRYGSDVSHRGRSGYSWSSSLHSFNSRSAYYVYFYDGYCDWYNNYRYRGQSVRPVSK